jgi:uncharacterized membrane protein YfhO
MFWGVYTLLFLITFLLAYSPFLLAGKSFIWKDDGQYQHYQALAYLGMYLRQLILGVCKGQLSFPMFDLNLGLGEDVISTLNYYGFNDPLNLLSALVPVRYTEYLYDALVVFRLYLSGLAFSAFCIHREKRASHTLIGALIYVFSGYAIYSAVRHPFFINPMIQFPLLLIGMDRIIKKKRAWLFIWVICYSALCGFYFLYMMTILLGVYALIRFFDQYAENRIRAFCLMLGRIIKNYLWGIGLAAVWFLPSVLGFLSSSRSGQTVDRNYLHYGWYYYRNYLLKVIAPLGSWDALALAAVTLLAAVLLFSCRERSRRSLKRLLLAALVIYLLPLGGYIMNGFGYPSQRWTFGFALLLAYITVELLPTLLHLNHRQKLLCVGTLLVYGVCVFVSAKTRSVYNVVGVAMLAVTVVLLLLLSDQPQDTAAHPGALRSAGAIVCTLLVMGNVSVNAIYRFAVDQGNYILDFEAHGANTVRLETAAEREAALQNDRDGRFDSPLFARNTGMIWRVPTLYSYWSISNQNTMSLWTQTENIAQAGCTSMVKGIDQRTILSTLLSTKYFIDRVGSTASLPYGYTEYADGVSETAIYENLYALPWGYTYDSYISYDELEQKNGLEIEEAMLQSIALEERPDGVAAGTVESSIETVPYQIQALNGVSWEDGVLQVTQANATVSLEFQMPAGTEGYLRLKGFDINGSGLSNFDVTLQCGDVSKSSMATSTIHNWYFGRENYLFCLGYSEEARTACTLTFPQSGTFRLEDIQLFALPMDKYPEQVEALRAEPLENIQWGTNRISGTVDLSANKILCMSIPYSAGWSAKVDGQTVKILRGNYLFMALPLTDGHHEIEFTYCTPGLKWGAILSAVSLAGFAAAAGYGGMKKRKSADITG